MGATLHVGSFAGQVRLAANAGWRGVAIGEPSRPACVRGCVQGHYKTLRRVGAEWFEVDDARVRRLPRFSSTQLREAYLLAYVRMDPKAP